MTKYIAGFLIGALISIGCAYAAAMPKESKHAQFGLKCTDCHEKGKFKPVATEKCLTCHDRDELAKSTEHLNYASVMKNPKTGETTEHIAMVNPHNSFHFGKTQECTDCHREHRPSVNDCATCHDVKAWKIKDPG